MVGVGPTDPWSFTEGNRHSHSLLADQEEGPSLSWVSAESPLPLIQTLGCPVWSLLTLGCPGLLTKPKATLCVEPTFSSPHPCTGFVLFKPSWESWPCFPEMLPSVRSDHGFCTFVYGSLSISLMFLTWRDLV